MSEPAAAHRGPTTTEPPQPLDPQLDRIQRPALIVGLGGLVLSLIGLFVNPERFMQSYLLAFTYWLGIPLGCLGLLMLQHQTGGGWGLVLRRMLEAGARLLPLMLVLFIPLVIGMKLVYPWVGEPHENVPPPMWFKYEFWLTTGAWLFRAFLYFAIWIGLSLLLNGWSAAEDRAAGDDRYRRRSQFLSGIGLLVLALTVTFAAVDWVMSIDPHWYSTMWGLLFIGGQILSTLALLTVLLSILYRRDPLAAIVTRDHFHDLGNLLLAFTMVWAYLNYSQFLIIWSANIAEETPYYFFRNTGWVKHVALFVVVFHFFIPFLLLLSRHNKRRVRLLAYIAGGIFVVRLVDLFWVIIPMFAQGRMHASELAPEALRDAIGISWLDVVLPIAMGGLFVAAFIWQLRRRPLVPPYDYRLADALRDFHHHHHDHAVPAYDPATGHTDPGPRPAGVSHG